MKQVLLRETNGTLADGGYGLSYLDMAEGDLLIFQRAQARVFMLQLPA